MTTREIAGIGLGLRRPFAEELLASDEATARRVDWLEITPENWMAYGGAKRRLLGACAARWPIVPHGVSLNVGGLDALDDSYLEATKRLVEELGAPFWSDHVCFSSVGGRPTHDLLPLPFSDEALDNLAARARHAAAHVGRPLVLENATFYAHMPVPSGTRALDEGTFLREAVARSGCDLLLDVNNVYVNAQNHGFDPFAFLDQMPLERVRYLHVAGHTRQDDVIIDTHIGPVIDEVWALYRHVLKRARRLIPTLVEWDQDIPPLAEVLAEVDRARAEAQAALAEVAA